MTDTQPNNALDTMRPWPSLAPYGKMLSTPRGRLFYYDSAGNADSKGNADSAAKADTGKNAGKPSVILVHGLADEADTWRHIFFPLAGAGYRVAAPDLPGFGRSLWKGRIGMGVHFRVVEQLLKMLSKEENTKPVLVGSSLGAGIAEAVACKRPDLAGGLLLIDGCFPFTHNTPGKNFLLMALPFAGKKWYRGFRKNHNAAYRSLYPYYGDLDSMDRADRNFLRERVIARVESPNQERGYFATLRSMNMYFLTASGRAARMVRRFPGKIAVIWGEKDIVFSQEKAARFLSLRPDVTVKEIAGAGHLPHQEKPEAVAAEMRRFLSEL